MSSVDVESIAPEHAHAPGIAGASKRTFKCAVHAEGAVSTGLAPQKHVKRWLEIGGAFDGSEREDLGGGIELVGKQYYSNGNRGVIFTADYLAPGARPRRVAIKELLHEKVLKPGRTFVEGALESEAKWLRELNQIGIGPELLYADDTRVVMEFVEGQRLLSYLHSEPDAANCRRTLALVLRQLRALDARSIQKGELVRPDRHILVRPDRTPVLLDFERCRAGHARPANVSQFGQFLGGRKLADALAAGGKGVSPDPERLRAAGAAYVGGGMRQEDFEALLRLVCGAEGGP